MQCATVQVTKILKSIRSYAVATHTTAFFKGNLYIHVKCNAPLNGFIARDMA